MDESSMFKGAFCALVVIVVAAPVAIAAIPRPTLAVELGGAWQQRNTAQVPNETPNTRFALDDITGDGPVPAVRLVLDWPLSEQHRLRFLAAPLRVDETGTSNAPIVFQGTSFAAGNVQARYRFDSYRASYRYVFHDSERWSWQFGGTVKVRDAEIELRQGALTRRKTDTGLVPLLALEGEWRFAPRWRAVFDFEGLAAPQGRAIDASLQVGYEVSPQLLLSAGYRFLDGGADNDNLYTFARFDYAVVRVTWRMN